MIQKRTIEQDMPVQGTDLKVRVEMSSSAGLDKLVVTNSRGKVEREITPFDGRRTINCVYPMTFDKGRFVVGSPDNPGVIKIDSDHLGVCEYAEYDVSNGELVSRYRVNM